MKRYRIVTFDFDSMSLSLEDPKESWDENIKQLHRSNKEKALNIYRNRYGEYAFDEKIQNIKDLGPKPFSILAYHNLYIHEVRESFIMGSYYPALTGICALGERVLNHLILNLRDKFKSTPEYKYIYKKKSFDQWQPVLDALKSWDIFNEEVYELYIKMNTIRNNSIHFNIQTEENTRQIALDAIKLFRDIVAKQFSAFGNARWFFIYPGECYIKKEYENHPFIELIYKPISPYVGFKNEIKELIPRVIIKDYEYEDNTEVTDEEFCEKRKQWQENLGSNAKCNGEAVR